MEMKDRITKLLTLKKQLKETQKQIGEEEAYFLKQAEKDLADSKKKSITYTNNSGDSVTITNAQEVKIIYPSYLAGIFKGCYADVVKEETEYKVSAQIKRMLCGICTGEYVNEGLNEVIKEAAGGVNDVYAVLKKKIKGVSFDSDKMNFKNLAGLNDEDAEAFAYYAAEAAVWDTLENVIKMNEVEIEPEYYIDKIKTACITEEKLKVAAAGAADED